MRYHYFTLALLLAANTSSAEVVQGISEMTCTDRKTLLALLDKYQEVPLIRGTSNGVPMVIYVNPQTQTWTQVELIERSVYCVTAAGEEFGPVSSQAREQFQRERSGRYN